MESFLAPLGCEAPRGEGCRPGRACRRQRRFMPAEKKDTRYWEKRRRNNEAAKRSREKRRLNDCAMESQLAALRRENALLRTELLALKLRFGLLGPGGDPYQGQALWHLLGAYFGGHGAASPLLEAEPFGGDSCLLASESFVPEVLEPGGFSCKTFCPARNILGCASKPAPVGTPGLQQPKGLEASFSPPVCSPLLDGRCPASCALRPSLPDGACFLCPSPRPAEVSKEGLGAASDEDDEQQVPKASPLPPGSLPCPPEEHLKGRSSVALPHKLRIKTKALSGLEESSLDSH
ncbi:NFIL3 like protein [Melanerpes formicivorus]|uniref:NFIL3 like protein n=1 Tax=Melanerpes formicivorus TaxID=211600 RepID=UPI00358EA31B